MSYLCGSVLCLYGVLPFLKVAGELRVMRLTIEEACLSMVVLNVWCYFVQSYDDHVRYLLVAILHTCIHMHF